MAGFSELIKNFSKTRDYVRDFFIYGYKVRNEFDRKSKRTYDDEKRRVESWLGDILRYDNTQRGKQVSISVDSGHISENPLYKAYYSKSFTDNDIKLHFMLCDILADKKLDVREITELLNERYTEIFDEQTVRNKLKEYATEGIFIMERCGKKDIFTLSPDTADGLLKSFNGLDDAVKFFSESSEFGVIGNSLLKKAELENNTFFVKHNYIVHTLEDEILLDIIELAEKKRLIRLINFGKQGVSTSNIGIPLRISISSQTGRRYLTMYLPEFKRFNSFRLDYIKSAEDVGACPDYDLYLSKLLENEKKCFGVSFGKRGGEEAGGYFKMVIYADEENEKFIIERLEREKRCGTVEKTGENLFTYYAEVFDINEMMHWVKTFIGRIVSIEGTNTEIINKFYSDI